MEPPEILSHGVISDGGTPGHRALEVTVDGVPTGLKILAATEEDVAKQRESVREALSKMLGVPVPDALDVIRPEGWPVKGIFGGIGS
jgi:hypothetical protein